MSKLLHLHGYFGGQRLAIPRDKVVVVCERKLPLVRDFEADKDKLVCSIDTGTDGLEDSGLTVRESYGEVLAMLEEADKPAWPELVEFTGLHGHTVAVDPTSITLVQFAGASDRYDFPDRTFITSGNTAITVKELPEEVLAAIKAKKGGARSEETGRDSQA